MVPAQANIEQFDRATNECQDPAKVRAWLPMLAQYGPDMLVTCRNASDLAEQLVSEWLASYMFKRRRGREAKASEVAKWLSTHSHFKSHGRPISRDQLRQKGLRIVPLEDDQVAQDLFLSVFFYAVTHTFIQAGAAKVIENHEGKAYIKIVKQVAQAQQAPAGAQPTQPSPAQEPPKAVHEEPVPVEPKGKVRAKAKAKRAARPRKKGGGKTRRQEPRA